MYKSEDCGLFIGLMTMPFGYERDFYEHEIEQGIFKEYKEKLQRFIAKDPAGQAEQEFSEHFYVPKAYCLFGSFDLAIISLVDDFALSSRVFHPYSALVDEQVRKGKVGYRPKSFNYQTITGTVPDLAHLPPVSKTIDKEQSTLIQKAKGTFLSSYQSNKPANSVYPFIGICALKISNALLIGAGGRMIQLVLRNLKGMIEQSEAYRAGNLDYLIISSFSWNELNIVFFSNSYKTISRQVLQIRELMFKELKAFDKLGFYEKVAEKCLLNKFSQQGNLTESEKQVKMAESHVFVETHTTFGYDFELLRHPEYLSALPPFFKTWQDITPADLQLYLRWHVKPGHLKEALKVIPGEDQTRIIVGRGDYMHAHQQTNLIDLLQQINQISTDRKNPLDKHIRKVYTVPEILEDIAQIPGQEIADSHLSLTQSISQHLTFSPDEIYTVRKQLKQCRISKILLDKVINIFVSFNHGIQDAVLYGYFIELRTYLEHIQREAAFYTSARKPYQKVDSLSKVLQTLCAAFEAAHRNRFQQSYIMNEITDYNIEFSGGIQQLVSAYDGAFKGISAILGCKDRYLPIAYVSSFAGVESNQYTVQLNYYHLFHPEFFVAVATHEAANFYLERLDTASGKLDNYLKLHELLTDKAFCEANDIPDPVSYFLVDIISYYVGYNTDAELFSYWHWGNFMSTSLYYNTDGSVNENMFAQLLLRILLLLKYTNKADQLSADVPPCEALRACWKKYFAASSKLADHLLSHPDLQDWYLHSEDIAKEVVIDDFIGITESIRQEDSYTRDQFTPLFEEVILKQHEVRSPERFFKQYENLKDREILLLLGRFEEMENIAQAIMDDFEKGQIFERRSFDILHANSFRIQTLFYAYLKLLKKLNEDELIVLERNEEGEPSNGTSPANRLLFDSMGGIFTRDFKLRRTYFQYRSLLIKSLWHISTKNKVRLFGAFEKSVEK